MTEPRYITPGATYLITRRCYQRTFRLRPSQQTNQILAYCLGLALEKTGVVLHAACFMSNHHHLVVSDPEGLLPDFLRELHRSTAKAMNASQGQWENLWSAEPCNVVQLVDDHDIVDKIAYVAANPVASGMVPRPEDWPGLWLWNGRSIRVARPSVYFDPRGSSPPSLTVQATAPSRASARGADQWMREVQKELAKKVARAHRDAAGRGFLGRAAVLAQSFVKRAKTWEPKRVLVPNVAAKDPIARHALLVAQSMFRSAYRVALERWRAGVREVLFPHGTWWMRVQHAAACASALGS